MPESKSPSDSATSVVSTVKAGRDANLNAGQDIAIEGGKIAANEDVNLTAGRDITVESAKNSHQTSSSSNSQSAGVGVGATASMANGVAAKN